MLPGILRDRQSFSQNGRRLLWRRLFAVFVALGVAIALVLMPNVPAPPLSDALTAPGLALMTVSLPMVAAPPTSPATSRAPMRTR